MRGLRQVQTTSYTFVPGPTTQVQSRGSTISEPTMRLVRNSFAQLGLARPPTVSESLPAIFPGSINVVTDAGSRCKTATHRRLWTNAVVSWSQTQVPDGARELYKTFSTSYKPMHWPQGVTGNTNLLGANGLHGVDQRDYRPGSRVNSLRTRNNSSNSPCGAGGLVPEVEATRHPPSCPS
ncbi:hypothetical protein PC119_g22219 [Phytophthora cactorum]|nr:hypothetical protein PC119_g22219 [Phytophthora cactorum]KAG3132142.1 hypothetical protein C6341_g23046 [Phytophthora cactorum]